MLTTLVSPPYDINLCDPILLGCTSDGTLTDSTASGGAASSKSSSGDCDAIISEFGMAVYVFLEEGHHAEQRLLHQD